MKIGIIGGTGGMGEGFALRWCGKHDIIIGSRDRTKAQEAADRYQQIAKDAYKGKAKGTISGEDNSNLAKNSDMIILSIPYESINSICSSISADVSDNCIIVSPIVPMIKKGHGFSYLPFENGMKSAAELVADNFGSRSRILSAFHTISEVKLRDMKYTVDGDNFVCCDDPKIVKKFKELIEIIGLRMIYLGPLSFAYQAELLTPMILNAAMRNRMKQPGLKIFY